jgi:uncharacterized LabA/DUF88 family protein
MAEASDPRVAVYIDFDNIVISRYDQVYGRGKFMADKARNLTDGDPVDAKAKEQALRAIVDVGAIIDYATSFGTVVISRAFADWSVPANSRYRRQLVDRAIDLTQLFPTAQYTKNGADIRLSVDVVEDMFRLPDITHVVIVAGDSDFIPLAQRCKRLGRHVVGIGVAGATSKQLAAACNEFAYYGELPGVEEEDEERESPRERRSQRAPAVEPVASAEPTTPTGPAPSTEPTDPGGEAAQAPKRKAPASRRASSAGKKPATTDAVFSELDEPTEAEREVAEEEAAAESPERGTDVTELLVRAMRLSHAKSDDEWLHSGGVKSQMQRMDPSFNEKALGFRSFSDFVKSRDSVVLVGKDELAGRIKLRARARVKG